MVSCVARFSAPLKYNLFSSARGNNARQMRRQLGPILLPLFPTRLRGLREQFAAVSRKEYDQSVRYVAQTSLMDGQRSDAAQNVPWKTCFFAIGIIGNVRETYAFVTTSPARRRPEGLIGYLRVAPAPRRARPTRAPPRDFRRVLHNRRLGKVSFHDDSSLRREARRRQAAELIDRA